MMGVIQNDGNGFAISPKLERNAGLIMATNNSTIAFKGVTERLYLPEPHFYKHFIKQPIQTSPAINRGYWLRMRAVEWVVRLFLEKPSAQHKVVINLGCGYDPLPFQWLSRERRLCLNTKFIDIDYELLMETKREMIFNHADMSNLLHPKATGSAENDHSVLVDTQEYAAIGCDLRNLRRLKTLIESVVGLEESTILCIAEDSTSYMRTEEADALISWCSRLCTDVAFCLLEPDSPDQPDNPFTAKMTRHYAKMGTPLRSIFEYPLKFSQTQRFREAGFTRTDYQNLWELWADPRFLSPSQRMALDLVEPFDAWEEFALWASHYCLVVAHNRDDLVLPPRFVSRRNSDASDASDVSARTSSPNNPNSQLMAFRYYKAPGDLCARHHGSSYPIINQDAIAVYGGEGPNSCRSTSAVCRPRHLKDEPPTVLPPEMVGARCCHICTAMSNGDNILVGGRASPTQPLRDCWLQKGDTWQRIHDLPEPRYRHRVVPVILPNNVFGAVCLGGKTGPSNVALDILLWEPSKGWRLLRALRNHPVPRFGPNFIRLGFNHGLLFGGMRQDGVICQDFWRWRLVIRDSVVVGISFRPFHALDASIGAYQWVARFGASYGFVQDNLLVIGGIAQEGCIPKPYEILSLTGSFSILHDERKEFSLRVTAVEPVRPSNCPRPFLIGHSTHRTQTGMFVIIGGGATCFNFGDFFNRGIWVLHDKEAGLSADWIIVPTRPAITPGANSEPSTNGIDASPDTFMIRRALVHSPEDFLSAMHRLRPIVIQDLDFGPCTQRWTLDYIRNKIHSGRPIGCQAGGSIDTSRQKSIQTYLEEANILSSSFYPHSLTTSTIPSRALNFHDELPELACDFHPPHQMESISSQTQAISFTMSNGIRTAVCHHVTTNVLFQVAGVKRLVLFPPGDLNKLEYPPGSTTSELRVFSNTGSDQKYSLLAPPGTSPHLATLKPGEALYIPPFWSFSHVPLFNRQHIKESTASDRQSTNSLNEDTNSVRSETSTSSISSSPDLESASASPKASSSKTNHSSPVQIQSTHVDIQVNISFRTLSPSQYSAGPNSADGLGLAAYEQGRQEIDKMVKQFTGGFDVSPPETEVSNGNGAARRGSPGFVLDGLPKEVAKALLERLGRELMTRADEL